MRPKVYISRPIGTCNLLLNDIIRRIHDLGAEAIYWIEGSYYKEDLIKSADAVVFITRTKENNIDFKEDIESLTRGVKSELKIAIQQQISIFKVYKTRTLGQEKLSIYVGITSEQSFKGVANTSNVFDSFIRSKVYINKSKIEDKDILTKYPSGVPILTNYTSYGQLTGTVSQRQDSGTLTSQKGLNKSQSIGRTDRGNLVQNPLIQGGNILGRWESNQVTAQQIPRIPTIEEIDKRILLLKN